MKLHRQYIKSYKKNTIAILMSMVMTIALVVCLLIVTQTDNDIKSLTSQYISGAYDIAFKDLTTDQIKEISSSNEIKYVELSKTLYLGEGNEKQVFSIEAANENYILERTKILEGRMPENKNEIIAEKWCLENLGVEPELNREFTVKVTDPNNAEAEPKQITYKVVGIISENATNKTYGSIVLYTQFKDNYENASLLLKYVSGVDIEKAGNEIQDQYQLNADQIHYNYDLLYYEYLKSQLNISNSLMAFLLLTVCAIVITGVYRISLMNRSSQYGILKAVGMQSRQIRKLIAAELYEVYFISIPIGVFFGLAVAYSVSMMTRDKTQTLVFWGKEYAIHLNIPIAEITICILCVGMIVGCISLITSRMINRRTAVDIIQGKLVSKNNGKHAFMTKLFYKSEKPYRAIALKYVFHDIKSTLFVVLSLSIGACLFIGLFYQAGLSRTMNEYEKQIYFYNGDFIMEKVADDLLTTGLSEDVLASVQNIEGVEEVDTERALPIRVIDDKTITRNQTYIDFFNESSCENLPFSSYDGNDGADQFYLSELKAYNESALENLHDYILEGDYDPSHMEEDSAILFMPMTIAKNDWRRANNYLKTGYYVMDYKVGDEITFKYRTDLETNTEAFYQFTDKDADYTYLKLKIAAIVYYPYMRQVSYMANAYPSLIISENQMNEIVPKASFNTISVSVDESLGEEYLNNVNDRLVQLAIENQSATARSIIDQTRDMDNLYRKQIIYSYGIALIVMLLASINIVNNLKYRICIRKKEISIYRAIGIKHDMICKMIRLENMMLGGIASVITCLVSFPITLCLYKKSQISYLQVGYHNDLMILFSVCIIILMICYIVSRAITKGLRESSIVENINDVE